MKGIWLKILGMLLVIFKVFCIISTMIFFILISLKNMVFMFSYDTNICKNMFLFPLLYFFFFLKNYLLFNFFN